MVSKEFFEFISSHCGNVVAWLLVLLPFFLKIVCPVFTFSLFYVVVAVGTVLFVVLMVVNMS